LEQNHEYSILVIKSSCNYLATIALAAITADTVSSTDVQQRACQNGKPPEKNRRLFPSAPEVV
jgi:hypothetical protein